MKQHTEQGTECQWDKSHAGQKTYRDSAAVWVTVKAMAKIQAKLGITEETINQNKAFILIGKLAGIDFAPEDFDRTKGAEVTKQEVKTAQADAGTNEWILEQIKAGQTEQGIKDLLTAQGWTTEQIAPYFKVETSVPLPPQ